MFDRSRLSVVLSAMSVLVACGGPSAGGSDSGTPDLGLPRLCGEASDCVDDDPCTRNEVCDTASATCTFTILDSDGDGEAPLVCGGTDCNDATGSVGAEAPERCGNERDDDCDGVIDTDATLDSDPNLRNDEANCGSCGMVCGVGQSCYQGTCVDCGADLGDPCCATTCSSATSCVGGTCDDGVCAVSGGVATCALEQPNCGDLGESCCAGGTCTGGWCNPSNVCALEPPPCGDLGESCCLGGTCTGGGWCDGNNVCGLAPPACSDAGLARLYRLTTLHIPSYQDAADGVVAGHDVDGVGDICSYPDYEGDVDNALIELDAALPTLIPDPPFTFDDAINTAITCPVDSPSCTRLDLYLSIATGTGCALVALVDAQGVPLAEPVRFDLDVGNHFRGYLPDFTLSIPYTAPMGATVIDLEVTFPIVSGNVSPTALTDVVIGGMLQKAAFESMWMDLIPLFSGETTYEDIEGILASLYDVQVNGACEAFSVGFAATGALVP